MASSYTALEQSILSELGTVAPSFSTSDVVSLFSTTNFLYSLAIMLIVVVAGWRYMLAGVWRMQASQSGMTKSNNEFRRVTLGLLGVLSLFLILYTFNKGLLKGDVGLLGLRSENKATGVTSGAGGVIAGGGGTFGGGGATGNFPPVVGASEQANRDSLKAQGITVNRPACTSLQVQQTPSSGPPPSCTNLADLPPSSLSMLIQLKDSCPGSSIVVTGGTEPGHKTHGPGKAAVDIRIGDNVLDTCIRKFPAGPVVSKNWCIATFKKDGFVFCDEVSRDAHWHVYK